MVLQLTDGANLCVNLICLSIYWVPAKLSAVEKFVTHLGYIFGSKVDVECAPVLGSGLSDVAKVDASKATTMK